MVKFVCTKLKSLLMQTQTSDAPYYMVFLGTLSIPELYLFLSEGCFVCCGNFLSVQFYGNQRLFEIVQVDVTKRDSSVLEDSLLQDMSLLSLQASTPKSGEVKVQGGPCLQAELESDTAEFPLSDIKVYKITSRTKPMFVEDHSNQKKASMHTIWLFLPL